MVTGCARHPSQVQNRDARPAGCGGTIATLLDAGYEPMYDLRFDNAHRSFRQWAQLHPDDPMGPVSEGAAYLFAEFDRMQILESEFFVDDDSFLHTRLAGGGVSAKSAVSRRTC